MAISEWVSGRVFKFVHGNNLVYNTCWEDPRLDRQALELTAQDRVLVITSAGCNALDYLLAGAGHVYAVDMNPRQNALLELKLSAIRNLDYERFFQMFGQGYLPNALEDFALTDKPQVLGPLDSVFRQPGQVVLLSRDLRCIRPFDRNLYQPNRAMPKGSPGNIGCTIAC